MDVRRSKEPKKSGTEAKKMNSNYEETRLVIESTIMASRRREKKEGRNVSEKVSWDFPFFLAGRGRRPSTVHPCV
jgi:hypothetical protein